MFPQSNPRTREPTIKRMAQAQFRIPIRVVFYQDDGRWVAHCLEFDLVGDGETKEAALRMLGDAIKTQVEVSVKHNSPATLFSPADGKLLAMFAAGKDVSAGELHMNLEVLVIEDAQFRKYTPERGRDISYAHA